MLVKLSNAPLNIQSHEAGMYIKQSGNFGGHPYWVKDSNSALWFDVSQAAWKIGPSYHRKGRSIGGLISTTATACPTGLEWLYWTGLNWNHGGHNIIVQAGNLQFEQLLKIVSRILQS